MDLTELEIDYSNYKGKDRIVTLAEYAKLMAGKQYPSAIATGIPDLDKHLGGGIVPGEVIVIAGPTKHGKTTLALSITSFLIKSGIVPLWFSYEMPPEILFLKQHPELFVNLPLTRVTNDVNWLIERIQESKAKYKTEIVFVDHLHFIADMFRMKNPSLEIGTIMRRLKTIAIDLQVGIYLIAHIGKEDRENPRLPTENDIRDSSFVTQEADSTIMVHRWVKDKRTGKIVRSNEITQICVSNHRRTGLFDQRVTARMGTDGYLREENLTDETGEIDYTKIKSRDGDPF